MATGNAAFPHIPASAVPIAGSSAAPPSGASATGTTNNSNTTTGTPTRLSRGNSFRIPLPPSSPAVGIAGAVSPSSPGASHSQLGTSYGSSNTTTSRLGNFALGFRRNRGASTNRGEIASPVVPPSPPAQAFPSLQPSTSLTDFGVPAYFDGTATNDSSSSHPALATSPSGHTPSASVGSASTTRGYFTRRGFGRKNTGGLLSGSAAGGRTPTSEQPPSLSSASALQRSRSSSQPSLPLSVSSAQQQQVANPSIPALPQQPSQSASAALPASTMVFSGTSQPVISSNAQTSNVAGGSTPNGGSSTDSSRRPSGEAVRAPATTASSSTMHVRTASQAQSNTQSAPPTATSTSTSSSSETQHIRLVPHLESTRSLHFDPVSRDILPTIPLRIGRFTDRNPNQPISALDQNRVAFKSKVVSRTHAEIWFEPSSSSNANGNNGWFIRDLKSSSGTFLNHIRLSGAGMESRPFPLRDGDVLQLGVDYQGGTEEIYRCVKMRIELNRGWQRGANSFNTNALRQIRALGNVSDQPPTTAGEESKSKKKKHRKHKTKGKKYKDAALADQEGDEGTASDGMQVDKKEKKKTEAPPSGVTDCCICLFSVTVYQALFIAPCSHIFHFKCIRPLLMQHHPGFSCPLCRTFGDLEADVEQDDVPEPVEEDSSSSSGESDASKEEVEVEEMEGIQGGAPALPDKDTSASASASIPPANAGASSENTAVLHTNAIQLVSSDPNLDTLRPGRKSPLVPSASHFSSASSTNAQDAPRTSSSSTRPSLDVARPPTGTRTPPSRGSRVASFQSVPPSGAAVTAALGGHTTPNNQHQSHHHHSHHHSAGPPTEEGSFNPPSAGDFDPDIRRGSIYVHGADGHAMHIPITGRSRPGSVHEGDVSTDAHHHHHHNAGNTQSPSVSAAEKNKARSVRSMRMTKSKNSTTSLRNAAAASAASPSGGTSSAAAFERQTRGSVVSSDDEDSNMDAEGPLTATHVSSAHAHFDTGIGHSASNHPQADTHMSTEELEQQDATPPSSHQEYLESTSDVADLRGKGKESRRHSGSMQRDINGTGGQPQDRQAGPVGDKGTLQDATAPSASVHAIV